MENSWKETNIFGGIVTGIIAWGVGYLIILIYLMENNIRTRAGPTIVVLDAAGVEHSGEQFIGWVFFNAHFVDVQYQNWGPFGDFAISHIGEYDGPGVILGMEYSSWLHLVPIVILLLAGISRGIYTGADSLDKGVISGAFVVPGYFIATVIGLYAFQISGEEVSAGPEIIFGILIAGITYPAVLACLGGAFSGYIVGISHRNIEK